MSLIDGRGSPLCKLIHVGAEADSMEGYFVGLHVLGVICLLPWIQHAPSKYTDYLDEVGQNKI